MNENDLFGECFPSINPAAKITKNKAKPKKGYQPDKAETELTYGSATTEVPSVDTNLTEAATDLAITSAASTNTVVVQSLTGEAADITAVSKPGGAAPASAGSTAGGDSGSTGRGTANAGGADSEAAATDPAATSAGAADKAAAEPSATDTSAANSGIDGQTVGFLPNLQIIPDGPIIARLCTLEARIDKLCSDTASQVTDGTVIKLEKGRLLTELACRRPRKEFGKLVLEIFKTDSKARTGRHHAGQYRALVSAGIRAKKNLKVADFKAQSLLLAQWDELKLQKTCDAAKIQKQQEGNRRGVCFTDLLRVVNPAAPKPQTSKDRIVTPIQKAWMEVFAFAINLKIPEQLKTKLEEHDVFMVGLLKGKPEKRNGKGENKEHS